MVRLLPHRYLAAIKMCVFFFNGENVYNRPAGQHSTIQDTWYPITFVAVITVEHTSENLGACIVYR